MTLPARLTIPAIHDALITLGHEAIDDELASRAAVAEELGAWLTRPVGRSAPPSGGGPLSGITFGAKDNIDTSALPTTGGTPALDGCQPETDAPVVRRLLRAGGVLAGKTNLGELAFGTSTSIAANGPMRNPRDPSRSPGGSSGGSAIAVAAGVVPFALGTDTGGSCRIPAAHCGVVGFRPSTGRWGAERAIPLSTTRDTIGLLATTVVDVSTVDAVVTGETALRGLSLRGLRLGVPRPGFFDDLAPNVERGVERALESIAAAGAHLVELSVPDAHELDASCGFLLFFREICDAMPGYLAGLPDPYRRLTLAVLAERAVSEDVTETLTTILADPITDAAYRTALNTRTELQRRYENTFERHDVVALLMPTAALVPPPLGDKRTTDHNGRQVDIFSTSIRNTAPGSVAGQPGLSLPVPTEAGDLPVGLSIEGARGDDRNLLATGAVIERALAGAS